MAAQRRRRRCGSGMGSRVLTTRNAHELSYAASVAGSTGSTMDGSSFSGLLTRVENRPHAHRLGGKRPHQVTRVRLLSQPAGVVGRCEDDRHPVVNLSFPRNTAGMRLRPSTALGTGGNGPATR
jgi:hypothetical protein